MAKQYELHPNQITGRRRQLLEGAADVFGSAGDAAPPLDLAPLHANIAQLTLEIIF